MLRKFSSTNLSTTKSAVASKQLKQLQKKLHLADPVTVDEKALQRTTVVYANTVGGFYTDKVNAIELEITSLPAEGLTEHGEYLFSRVFEVYGYNV